MSAALRLVGVVGSCDGSWVYRNWRLLDDWEPGLDWMDWKAMTLLPLERIDELYWGNDTRKSAYAVELKTVFPSSCHPDGEAMVSHGSVKSSNPTVKTSFSTVSTRY